MNSSRRHGAAMLLVLIALVISSIVAVSFLSRSTATTAMAKNMSSLTAARGVAESGLEITIAHIENDEDWRDGLTEGQWVNAQAHGVGTFDVWIYDGRDEDGDGVIDSDGDLEDDTADPVTLQVVGRVNGVAHRVSAVVYDGDAESSNQLVLVVGTNPLSDQDLAKKALAEGWGWAVTTLLDSAGSSTYDDALAEADVVWVSEEANSSSVGSKLTDLTIGVVNEERALYDDLLLAASGASVYSDEIEVVNNSHYITSHLSNTAQALTTAATELCHVSSGLTSSANILATRPDGTTPMLVAHEAYEPLTDGSSGVGRRVILPFGGNGFSIGLLNDDGKEVLRKSLIWASQSPDVPTPVAHWPFDETTGTTVADRFGNYDGSYINSPQLGQPAVFTTAPVYDDDTDRVSLPAAAFDGRGDCSLSFWFKTTATNVQTLFSTAIDGNDNSFSLILYSSTNLRMYYSPSANISWRIDNVADGKWHHLVVVRDDQDDQVTLYLDGEAVGTIGLTIGTIEAECVILGEDQDFVGGGFSSTQSLKGGLDDMQLFDRTLRANEVAAIYADADYDPDSEEPQVIASYDFQQPAAVSPSLLSHWALDEPAGGAIGWAVITDNITMSGNSRVDGYDMSAAYGPTNRSAGVRLSTDETGSNTVYMSDYATIDGNLFVGPAVWIGNYVNRQDNATVTGEIRALDEEVGLASLGTPSGRPSGGGNQTFSTGTITINADQRYGNLTLKGDAQYEITGDVEIFIDKDFTMQDTSRIVVPSGSSLTVWVGQNCSLSGDAAIHNDSTTPERVSLMLYGTDSSYALTMSDDAAIYGRVYACRDVTMIGNAAIYGALACRDDLVMQDNAGLHVADTLPGFAPTQAFDTYEVSDGTFKDDATPGVGGKFATAADFDGDGDYLVIPHDGSYLTDQGAISFWFQADALSGTQSLLAKSSTGWDASGHLNVYLSGSTLIASLQSDRSTYTVSQNGVSAGSWHHAVLVWGGNGLTLYFNGLVADTDEYAGGLGTSSGGAGNYESILLGARQVSTLILLSSLSDFFDGRIDELRFYGNQLTADQVAELFAGDEPTPAVPSVVYDTANAGDALDLYIRDPSATTWISGGGLQITSNVQIISSIAASKIAEAVAASESVTVEILFTTHDDSQSGPANILHYGSDGSALNVAVGQHTDEAVSYLTTASLFSNGTPEVDSGAILVEDSPTHFMVAYDREDGEIRVFKNGVTVLTESRNGSIAYWDDSDFLTLANNAAGTLPWQGSLYRVAIWDQAFNAKQAANVYNGEEPGDGLYGGMFKTIWLERPE